MDEVTRSFEEMELDRKKKEAQVLELKNEVTTLYEKIEIMNRSLNRHEQCSRRNFLLIQRLEAVNYY